MAHLPPEPSPERHHGIDDIPVWTRRGVVLGMCVTAAAALTVGERVLFPARRWLGEVEEEAAPRTLPWAVALAAGSDQELWQHARWFCWTAADHPQDARLRRGLDRLVDLSIKRHADPVADELLGHVLQVLRAGGAWDRLREIEAALQSVDDLATARALLHQLLTRGTGR